MAQVARRASTTPSSARACPFCGRPLRARYADLKGHRVFFGYEECHCDGAEADRARRDAAEAEERERAERERQLSRRRSAGVPRRYIDASDGRAPKLADAMEGGRWLYLCGKVGTGKTTLLCATANELLGRGRRVRVMPFRDVLTACERAFRDGSDPIGEIAAEPFLMLDDVGKEQPTGFVLSRLFSLVDTRWANEMPTAVTTQYEPSRLQERLSQNGDADTAQAIVSRLQDGALGMRFNGPDLRVAR